MMQELDLTEGQAAIMLFETWMEMLSNGEVKDSQRFNNDFFDRYKGVLEKSPMHLMFCAFVGAMDLDDKLKETNKNGKN